MNGFNCSIIFLNALFYYSSHEMEVVVTLTCFKVTFLKIVLVSALNIEYLSESISIIFDIHLF